jgi:hypothetical protein
MANHAYPRQERAGSGMKRTHVLYSSTSRTTFDPTAPTQHVNRDVPSSQSGRNKGTLSASLCLQLGARMSVRCLPSSERNSTASGHARTFHDCAILNFHTRHFLTRWSQTGAGPRRIGSSRPSLVWHLVAVSSEARICFRIDGSNRFPAHTRSLSYTDQDVNSDVAGCVDSTKT